MDILTHLQLSLTDHCEQAFNEAYRNLATEISARDMKIRELEARNKVLQTSNIDEKLRVQELECRVKQLEDGISHERRAANEEFLQETAEKKLSALQSTYDPEKLMNSIHESRPENTNKTFDKSLQRLEASYRALYDEVRTLLSVTDSLRIQVKRHKERAVQWQRWRCQNNSIESIHDLPELPLSPAVINLASHDQVRSANAKPQLDISQTKITDPAQSATSHGIGVDGKLQRPVISQELSHPHQLETSVSLKGSVRSAADMAGFTSPAAESTPTDSQTNNDNKNSKGRGRDHESMVRIKTEPPPSSPIHEIPSCQEMDVPGTQDLDDVGHLVDTPKRKTLKVYEENTSTPPGNDSDNQYTREKELHALQSRDVNQIVSGNKFRDTPSKRRRINRRGAAAISSVSEDGENRTDTFSKHKVGREDGTSPKTWTRKPQTCLRLDELLKERPQVHRQSLDQRSFHITVSGVSDAPRQDRGTLSHLANGQKALSAGLRRENEALLQAHENCPATEGEFACEPRKAGEGKWKSIAQSVPYRERPVDFLDLNCFKPNPARNDGLNFAFKEVIRNHDQRKCLPGCMRPDCCGNKFRAMVRASGVKFEEKDRTLLEDYLGDRKHVLDKMSDTERHDLFIEAKAKVLADQFGRHRPAHDRPRSPPGFWRADMPSTQELASDRKEADRMERDKIIERVQEAMRPNGLWKFADEA